MKNIVDDVFKFSPKLKNEWDYEKNSNFDYTKLHFRRQVKVWWRCGEHAHSWEAVISKRSIRGDSCPYCGNQKILKGFNDLQTKNPLLAKEWHPYKNKISPTEVMEKSNIKAWWLGRCGHEWEAFINVRSHQKTGCPYCSGKKILVGFNDFKTIASEELLSQWDSNKNAITPSDVNKSYSKPIWWTCELNHSWRTSISNRLQGKACPYCTNVKTLKGFNDIRTTHSELCEEWDYEKNATNPEEYTFGSNVVVWWRCRNHKEHSWKASVNSRTSGKGCAKCCYEKGASRGEKELYHFINNYIKSKNPLVRVIENDRSVLNGKEIDILIPSLGIGFEYNGTYWHSDERILKVRGMSSSQYDEEKTKASERMGVTLFFVKEEDWTYKTEETKSDILDKIDKMLRLGLK